MLGEVTLPGRNTASYPGNAGTDEDRGNNEETCHSLGALRAHEERNPDRNSGQGISKL